MDKRALFLFVFTFTAMSTLLVAFVSFWTGQRVLDTVLFSLATMWITGVVSQLLLQHVYLGIIRPMEELKYERMLAKAKADINIDDVEEIDQVEELEEAKKKAEAVEADGRKSRS